MAFAKQTTISCGFYTIQKLPAIPSRFETQALIFKLSILTAWTLWTLYIGFQYLTAIKLLYVREIHPQWHLWTAIISEVLLDFPSAVLAFSIALGLLNVPEGGARPQYRLHGDLAPDIDVMVTCCGEAAGIISNTAAAAATQDYPADRLRVYVLDDGHDGKLESVIGKMNQVLASKIKNFTPITYLSRQLEPSEPSNFKSGNLRFGIAESKIRLTKYMNGSLRNNGSSECLIAALDADMIPERNWAQKMVPHLLLNDDVGLVSQPQKYYNIPETASDTLGQLTDFDIYFTVQEALNDRLGAAMCTGTGYIARRSAIESIGGWPLADSGEDYMCSAMLSDQGWGIAFVRENLQFGLAPTNIKTLVKQRMRWTDAGIEVHQRLGYYLPGLSAIASRMTPGQRAVNMLYVLRDFSPLGITLAMIVLPLAVLSAPQDSFTDFITDDATSLSRLRKLALLVWIAQKVNTWVLYQHIGLARVANFHSQEVWTAPYSAYRNIIDLLPRSFSAPEFVVCGATSSALNECSAKHRKPLLTRLLSPDITLFVLYIIYALSPLLLGLPNRATSGQHLTGILAVCPGAAVKLIGLAAKVSTPVRYMIWPPDIPEWDELLEEDENGVKRPKQGPKEGDGWMSWVSLWWLFVWGCELGVLCNGAF